MYFCRVLSALFFTVVLTGLFLLGQEILLWRFLQKGLRENTIPQDQALTPLSVLICAHNEEVALRQNLPLVLLQQHPQYKVWVGLDHCSDRSLEVVQQWAKHFPHLKYMERQGQKPSKKAMQGQLIAAAEYPSLVFTDADCRPASPQWLAAYSQAFQQGQLILGVGLLHSKSPFMNALVQWETAQTALLYQAAAFRQKPYMGVGRNMGYRQELYKPEYTQPRLRSGDDDLLVNALSGKVKTAVIQAPETFTYSAAPDSWAGWWRQKRRHHSTAFYYRRSQQFSLALRGLGQVVFWPGVVLGLAYHPLAALLAGALRYLITLILQWRSYHHFKACLGLLTFPFWETVWAWSVLGIHIQNIVKKRTHEW